MKLTAAIKLSKVKPAALTSVLTGPEVRRDLDRRAKRVAKRAGEGMVTDAQVGRHRARASVRTGTYHAMYREARRRELTAALDAARG